MIVIMPYFLSWHPTKSYHRVTIKLFICCLLGPTSLWGWSSCLIFDLQRGPSSVKNWGIVNYNWSMVLTLFFFLYFYSTFPNIQNYEAFSRSIDCLCLLVPYKYKVLYGLKLIGIYEFKIFQTTPSLPNVCGIWLLHQL
jgi:hypothetical protein